MISLEHLGTPSHEISLAPDTPAGVRDDLDPRTSKGGYGYATVLVTPQHITPGDLTDAEIRDLAFYGGVHHGLGQDRQSVVGRGLVWLLGEDDGGVLWTAADSSQAGWDIEAHLDEWVFGGTGVDRGNGITKGAVSSDATTFTIRFKAGQTPRQTLAFACVRRSMEWRMNPDATLDVDTAANLFRSGQVMLIDEGGRDGNITGITADLSLDGIDVESCVWDQYVDWDGAATAIGSATTTPPSTYDAPDGGAIQWRAYQRGTPKQRLRDDEDVDKVAAWLNANQTAASTYAATILDKKNSARLTISAEIDEANPLRFIQPGDTAYVYDQRLGLYDTTNQVPFRGRTAFPTTARCVGMDLPCLARYGYYLRLSDGSLIDFTRWVEPENRGCVLELGRRGKFTRRAAKPRGVTRFKNRQAARYIAYANATGG